MEDLLADLDAEHGCLDRIVSTLDDDRWDLPTPAEPWTIRDQVSHLALFDEKAASRPPTPPRSQTSSSRSSG